MSETVKIPAVVLAGGKAKPELAEAMGHDQRALFVYKGETLLSRVTGALEASGLISEITVIGNVPGDPRYKSLPDTNDLVMNVFAGAETYRSSPSLLMITSDLPFIDGASVRKFVEAAEERANATDAAVVYPFVPLSSCQRDYPEMRRTAIRIADGVVTGGNAMLLKPDFLLQRRNRIADAYAARKSPFKLAMMLGLGVLARLILSQKVSPNLLSQSYLEERVSKWLGATARGIQIDAPALAADFDRAEDLKFLQS